MESTSLVCVIQHVHSLKKYLTPQRTCLRCKNVDTTNSIMATWITCTRPNSQLSILVNTGKFEVEYTYKHGIIQRICLVYGLVINEAVIVVKFGNHLLLSELQLPLSNQTEEPIQALRIHHHLCYSNLHLNTNKNMVRTHLKFGDNKMKITIKWDS